MNSKKFKPRSLIETLELLCFARGGKLLRAGKINQSEIARLAGTHQGNVSRWFSKEHHPTDDNVTRLAKAFKITPAQMRGEQPISNIDELTARTPEDEELISEISNLPEEVKELIHDLIRDQIRLYKKMKNHS